MVRSYRCQDKLVSAAPLHDSLLSWRCDYHAYLMATTEPLVEKVSEPDLRPDQKIAISALLRECFPEYPNDRIFYPQPPHLRLLHWEGGRLTGQVGVVLREIRVGEASLQVMGVADLCTSTDRAGLGVATRLLRQMEDLARSSGIPFLMAMALNPELYVKMGFYAIDVRCIWLSFLNGRSLGLFQRTPPAGLMVNPLSDLKWPDGEVDLMGPLF